MEIEFRRPDITADTDILSRVVATDDEGRREADFGKLLVDRSQEYLECFNLDVFPILLIDDFEESALRDGITSWDAFEEAYMARHWSTTHWKNSVMTRIEPMTLSEFQHRSKYFTRDSEGHLVFLEDDLSLAAWIESKFIVSWDEKVAFARWCFENGKAGQ